MRTITIDEGQSLVDVAVQEFGTADGLSVICDLNNLEFDQDLIAGQTLLLPDADSKNDLQQYLIAGDVKVNSHILNADVDVLGDGNGNGIGDGGLIGV